MNTVSDDQRFLDLLQRWQSGDFTRQDERTLRGLAESDDFRREAMEGFMALPEADHQTQLAALRERLRPAIAPRRVIPMPQLMAIAAALLLLVAAIWFFPRSAKQQDNSIAQTSAPASPVPEAEMPATQTDSQASGALAESVPRRQPAEQPYATQAPLEKPTSAYQAPAGQNRDMAVEESASSTPPATEPAPAAVRPSVADDASPGGRSAALSKAKMADKTAAVKTEAKPADTTAWNDTEKKSDLERLRREVRADQLGPAQSEPAEGWPAFAEYLRQNARLPLEARDRNVSGNVRLQFTVSPNGDPQNFVVLRSLGQSCDDEAKRLVQNWTWIRGQNPLVTVEVKFVR